MVGCARGPLAFNGHRPLPDLCVSYHLHRFLSMLCKANRAGLCPQVAFPAVPHHGSGPAGRSPGTQAPHDLLALRHSLTPRRVRLDPARDAGHSLRSGLATAAAQAGVGDRAIMAQTGHRAAPWSAATSAKGASSATTPPPPSASSNRGPARRRRPRVVVDRASRSCRRVLCCRRWGTQREGRCHASYGCCRRPTGGRARPARRWRASPRSSRGASARWAVARGAIDAVRATVARLERTLAAEQRRAARDLAAHDQDRRSARRRLRVAEGALHRAVRDGWLGAEEARARSRSAPRSRRASGRWRAWREADAQGAGRPGGARPDTTSDTYLGSFAVRGVRGRYGESGRRCVPGNLHAGERVGQRCDPPPYRMSCPSTGRQADAGGRAPVCPRPGALPAAAGLALLAGSVLSYAAATQPAVPTGFWDRRPAPTPGRLRRVLARYPFPHDYPLPARLREKAAVTAHLPKGWLGHRRRATSATAAPVPPRRPPPSAEAA